MRGLIYTFKYLWIPAGTLYKIKEVPKQITADRWLMQFRKQILPHYFRWFSVKRNRWF